MHGAEISLRPTQRVVVVGVPEVVRPVAVGVEDGPILTSGTEVHEPPVIDVVSIGAPYPIASKGIAGTGIPQSRRLYLCH